MSEVSTFSTSEELRLFPPFLAWILSKCATHSQIHVYSNMYIYACVLLLKYSSGKIADKFKTLVNLNSYNILWNNILVKFLIDDNVYE